MRRARNLREALNQNIRRIVKGTESYAMEAVTRGAAELRVVMRTELSQPGSGIVYPSRRGDGTDHRASAKGEPPAPDTGNYRASVYTAAGPEPTGGWFVGVGSKEPYAETLEYDLDRPHFSTGLTKWLATFYVPRFKARLVKRQRGAAAAGGGAIYITTYVSPTSSGVAPAKSATTSRWNPRRWFR